jgi:tripartite-type tricarboxylate transporter receptor subunit TctC
MGLIAPGGTPPALIAAINKDVVEALQARAVKDKLATQYMEPVGNSPAEFRAVIDGEISRWSPIIKAGNVKIN